jgi:hypothetical protein
MINHIFYSINEIVRNNMCVISDDLTKNLFILNSWYTATNMADSASLSCHLYATVLPCTKHVLKVKKNKKP